MPASACAPCVKSGCRYKNERREKTRSFAHETKPFLLAGGNLREVSCDWHIATPGVKLPFFFFFSLVNFRPFSFLFVVLFQDDDCTIPLHPGAGGEGLTLRGDGPDFSPQESL